MPPPRRDADASPPRRLTPPSLLLATFMYLLLLPMCPPVALGQEPQEGVHPWLKEYFEYGCPFINYFSNHDHGVCELCPNDGINVSEEDCLNLNLSSDADAANITRAESCIAECIKGKEGELCSIEKNCEEGMLFCNFDESAAIEDDTTDINGGICRGCKRDVSECFFDDTITSEFGMEECMLCDLRVCIPLHYSVTQVDGESDVVASNAMRGSPSLSASGPLVDCTNLIYDGETECDNNADANDKVCLVNDETRNSLYIDVVNKCTDLGGVAVIFYGNFAPRTPNEEPLEGSLGYNDPSLIPSVSIPYNDGKRLQENKLGTIAQVNTSDVGSICIKRQFCSDDLPCVGNSAGQYCSYKWNYGEEGFCQGCPVDGDGNPSPLSCFFSIEDWGKVTGQKAVESCAQTCAANLTFPNCKLCPNDVTGFDFGVESDADRCAFCPENDIPDEYKDKEFPLFGEGIKCWQVQKFFQTVNVNEDATNCQLAQMQNYVCGCSGSGYAGASTQTKQKVLVWLPRMMAILSFFGSSFIIYDASKYRKRREKLQNQLLIGLSTFDIFGSIAYAFTTLPIPEDYAYGPIYGAEGNDATCTAQGFFIQIGTISAYTNVSLSIYYLLVIKHGWSEIRVKKIRLWLFLFPVLVGFAFAFAGIPFYGPLALWCNNTASYWPDIPVAVAIGSATVIMGSVCWDVYSKEKATKKYHGSKRQDRTSLSTKVIWQSFFYLLAFYLTWPVYLALQYTWAGGNAFKHYGFILAAGTMVPLQGFWNMLVYLRPRYNEQATKTLRSTYGTLQTTMSRSIKFKKTSSSARPPESARTQETESGKGQSRGG